jgi:hypothetical protein
MRKTQEMVQEEGMVLKCMVLPKISSGRSKESTRIPE